MVLDNKIIVSVAMVTYNHEKYIREALDSILMQIVDFKYEVIIGDDCSSDNTGSILQEYEKKYQDIFKIIYRNVNIGPTKNIYDVFLHCNGDYIAQLEGDDFWDDPQKLQKQVEFLELNKEYIGSAHSCSVLCDNKVAAERIKYSYLCKDGTVFTFEDYKRRRFAGHTCTMVYRNIYRNNVCDYTIIYRADKYTGDRTINMLLVAQGDIYCMGNFMSTYRSVCNKEASNVNSLFKGLNRMIDDWNYEEKLDDYCKEVFGRSFLTADNLAKKWMQAAYTYIKRRDEKSESILKEFTKKLKKKPNALFYILKHLIKPTVMAIFRLIKCKKRTQK